VPKSAIVSFRLGGGDGVSVEAGKWARALVALGYEVRTVAGTGTADRLLPGLGIAAASVPSPSEVETALAGVDLVVVENLCSLPLNPEASIVVAECCKGRPTILHHHDLPWQRAHLAHHPPPPDDPCWRHVTINALSRHQLLEHGIDAVVVYNTFDMELPRGRRSALRRALGLTDEVRLVVQPTRALPRKNIPGALRLTSALGGTYWLLGPAEDGYGPELEELLARATCPVRHGLPGPALRGSARSGSVGSGVGSWSMADVYAAADVVALPSTWEGFGNPTIESVVHRRPLAVGAYPVAAELMALGFEWFQADNPAPLARWLEDPDPTLFDRNLAIARRHFSSTDLPTRLAGVIRSLGLPAPAGPEADPPPEIPTAHSPHER
jgi:glycosyltransferase involved in cell wall biosynthesis